jgi:hypothetical protein
MSRILLAGFCVLALGVFRLFSAPAGGAQKKNNMQKSELEREEFHQSYRLAAGSRLEVSGVALGSFLILPTDTDVAEVHITRSARDRAELACGKLVVNHSPAELAVKDDEKSSRPGQDSTLCQDVILKIPRGSDVSLNDIQGPVILGEIEGRGPNFIEGPKGEKIPQPVDRPSAVGRGFSGSVRMNKIRGPIRFVQGAGGSEIVDVSGPLVVAVRSLGSQGLDLKRVDDLVEIILSESLNAHLLVRDIKGQVLMGKPEGIAHDTGRRDFSEQIGAGGAPISVKDIGGDVIIRRR